MKIKVIFAAQTATKAKFKADQEGVSLRLYLPKDKIPDQILLDLTEAKKKLIKKTA